MLPPADFRLAKIVAEIITSKQKVLPWSIAWQSDFDGAETLGEILEFWRNNVLFDCLLWTFLLMIVVGEILHLQGSFQGALVLDNCIRYRCNRPGLYLTEEHSIRREFCLVNQKLFHLIWSASVNQLSLDPQKTKSNDRRSKKINYMSECTEMYRRIFFTMYGNVLKKLFRKSFGWVREHLMQFWAK